MIEACNFEKKVYCTPVFIEKTSEWQQCLIENSYVNPDPDSFWSLDPDPVT